jgi:hypothetical protein
VLARCNPRNAGATPRYTAIAAANTDPKPLWLSRFLAICGDLLGHLMGQISIGDNHCTATVLSQ